jgi:hypothetical protein
MQEGWGELTFSSVLLLFPFLGSGKWISIIWGGQGLFARSDSGGFYVVYFREGFFEIKDP